MNTREFAKIYSSLGWYPIPLRKGEKACRDANWITRVYSPEEFAPDDNIGIRLVKASEPMSKKLVSVDLDASEAVAAARDILPQTNAIWGRKSKPVSQMLYLSPFEKPLVFKDAANGSTIVEIRAGHQSMAPPSVHPSGEVVEWLNPADITATTTDPEELARKTRLVATCALIARYYAPPGARHEWTLCVAGALRQFGLTEQEADLVVSKAADIAGDRKKSDRLTETRTTFALSDADPIAGISKLTDIAGEKLVESLRSIWGERSPFTLDARGKKILSTDQNNIRRALEIMNYSFSYDEFSGTHLARNGDDRPQALSDTTVRSLWLGVDTRFHFRPSKEFFLDVIYDTARKRGFHPVLDYLKSLKWDEKPRIDEWLITYGKARDAELVRAISAIVLIAAARRVETPGIKFDELLVLESPQGKNKSLALRALCPDERWFSDDLPLNVDAKQVIERTGGKWIIEAAELSGMRRAHVEHLKAFLSRQVDGPVRLAYGRVPESVPRQFILIGTTNAREYLKDEDNRRFWPVRVKTFDVEGIRRDRDQLWAEAWTRREESIRLKPSLWREARIQQEHRRAHDPWEEKLHAKFGDEGPLKIPLEAVWETLGISLERRTRADGERISAIMQKLGAEKRLMRMGDRVARGWFRGAELEE